jgi:TonB family protein
MALGIITKIQNNHFLHTPAGIMKVCLAISFLVHIFLLMSLQRAFPDWKNTELRTYNIEIIRPPTEGLNKEEISGFGADSLEQKDTNASADSQETISLDTKDERYVQYAGIIKKNIMEHWDYPDEAKLSLWEGKAIAFFSLARNGSLTEIKITGTSGYDILDREVLRAVKASAPFPSFPASVKVNRLNIKASFDYRLSSAKKGN